MQDNQHQTPEHPDDAPSVTLLQVSFGVEPESVFTPWMLPRHCPSLPLRRWVTAWFSRLRAMLNS